VKSKEPELASAGNDVESALAIATKLLSNVSMDHPNADVHINLKKDTPRIGGQITQ